MRSDWIEDDLVAEWLLQPGERELLRERRGATRLGFALQLKFFQIEGRFPAGSDELPSPVIQFMAQQLDIPVEVWPNYCWSGRTIKYQRAEIRLWLGFREAARADHKTLQDWLLTDVLDQEHRMDALRDAVLTQCRVLKIEPPAAEQIRRLIRTALQEHETQFCTTIFGQLDKPTLERVDELLKPLKLETPDEQATNDWSVWQVLKSEPGKAGLESVLQAADRLQRVRELKLRPDLFKGVPPKLIARYARRATVEEPFELRRHAPPLRTTLMAAFLHERGEELTDHLIDLLVETIHKMGKRAENRIEEDVTGKLKKIPKKLQVLFRMAEASLKTPKGAVDEVIYPVASEELLRNLLQEIQLTGSAKSTIQTALQRSYRSHYRRMLPVMLNALEFRCTNSRHQPVMQALEILKQHLDHKGGMYPPSVEPPIEGVVRPSWKSLVVEKDADGKVQVNRIAYEICALKALRDQLRCREIWVVGSRRYRNPDEDLPQDFDEKREAYYAELGIPLDPKAFTASLREEMRKALQMLDEGLPANPKVKILNKKKSGWIAVSPSEAQPYPENLGMLKGEIWQRWSMTSLLDMLKETDLRTHFSACFRSPTDHERLDPRTLQRRLLFCLYGLGANIGLKRIASGQSLDDYKELLYVRRRFISIPQLRQAIAQVANATLAARLPHIWGEATTSCAADSKQLPAWDQNLLTEWHMRYGGRGVMVYWHVEVMVYWHVDKNSCCIYSQLKRVSSSEAAAMIQGVIRHCTEMKVEQQYVDTHGQTDVAFAFCRLLNFELMPRFKNIHKQKLYRPEAGNPDAFPNLQAVLTRSINWELVEQELDAMVKHTIALKTGMADAESLLRRFTRTNIQHPTYKAFSELGKAIKTIFLCRYLHSEQLRREVHEGLNVVESWNAANDFIMVGKGGELTSNRQEDQEVSLLCLHLLQSSLVYINTLMIQEVLEDPAWLGKMTPRDRAALSPLFTNHVNPFGRFDLDLETRIPFGCRITLPN